MIIRRLWLAPHSTAVYRIAEHAFEPVPIKFAVRLHVTDGRFDRASPANHRAQPSRDTVPQSRVINLHALDGDTLVAARQWQLPASRRSRKGCTQRGDRRWCSRKCSCSDRGRGDRLSSFQREPRRAHRDTTCALGRTVASARSASFTIRLPPGLLSGNVCNTQQAGKSSRASIS